MSLQLTAVPYDAFDIRSGEKCVECWKSRMQALCWQIDGSTNSPALDNGISSPPLKHCGDMYRGPYDQPAASQPK